MSMSPVPLRTKSRDFGGAGLGFGHKVTISVACVTLLCIASGGILWYTSSAKEPQHEHEKTTHEVKHESIPREVKHPAQVEIADHERVEAVRGDAQHRGEAPRQYKVWRQGKALRQKHDAEQGHKVPQLRHEAQEQHEASRHRREVPRQQHDSEHLIACRCMLRCKVFGGHPDRCDEEGDDRQSVKKVVSKYMERILANPHDTCEGMHCIVECARNLKRLDAKVQADCLAMNRSDTMENCHLHCDA